MKRAVIVYFCIGFATALWFDAMDRRYPPGPNLPAGNYFMTTLFAAMWPASLAISLGMMLTEDGGRWRLTTQSVTSNKRGGE